MAVETVAAKRYHRKVVTIQKNVSWSARPFVTMYGEGMGKD